MKLVQKIFKTGYNLTHDTTQMLLEIPSKNHGQRWFCSGVTMPQRVGYLTWRCILILLTVLPTWCCPENTKLEQDLNHSTDFCINYSFMFRKDYAVSSINWINERRHTGRWQRLQCWPSRCRIWAVCSTRSLVKSFRTLTEENINLILTSRCTMLRNIHGSHTETVMNNEKHFVLENLLSLQNRSVLTSVLTIFASIEPGQLMDVQSLGCSSSQLFSQHSSLIFSNSSRIVEAAMLLPPSYSCLFSTSTAAALQSKGTPSVRGSWNSLPQHLRRKLPR